MKHINNLKRPRLATIIAGLALMIALGGTATAAGLISGKQLKNNTVTGKKLKNRTITKKKIAPATIKALKGQKGPQGAPGPKGDQGPKGDPGTDGILSPTYKELGSVNLPANTELAIGTLNVPAGKYLVTATANVFSLGTANFGCGLTTNGGGGSSESATWSSPVANSRTTLPIQMLTTTDKVTQITMGCHPGNIGGSASGTLMVTPVQ